MCLRASYLLEEEGEPVALPLGMLGREGGREEVEEEEEVEERGGGGGGGEEVERRRGERRRGGMGERRSYFVITCTLSEWTIILT